MKHQENIKKLNHKRNVLHVKRKQTKRRTTLKINKVQENPRIEKRNTKRIIIENDINYFNTINLYFSFKNNTILKI